MEKQQLFDLKEKTNNALKNDYFLKSKHNLFFRNAATPSVVFELIERLEGMQYILEKIGSSERVAQEDCPSLAKTALEKYGI